MTRIEPLEDRRLLAFALGNLVQLSGSPLGNQVSVRDVATDRAGSFYLAGQLNGTVDFDTRRNHAFPLTSAGDDGDDAFVAKYTSDGRLRWARQLTAHQASGSDPALTTAGALAVDGDGGVYLSGTLNGTADFNPFPKVFELESDREDAFVWKLNSDGILRWATIIPSLRGSPVRTSAVAMAIDASGDPVVTGEMLSSGDEIDGAGFVARLLGTTGAIAYDNDLPVDAVRGMAAAANSDGNVVISGRQQFNPGRELFVTKVNRKGNVVWYKTFEAAISKASSQGVALSRRGAVFVTGAFGGAGSFGDTKASAAGQDAFLMRLDTNGDVKWARTWGGSGNDSADDVTLDVAENVIVGGRFAGAVDLNPGSGTAEFDSGNTADGSVSRFNAAGAFSDVSVFGGRRGFPATPIRVVANRREDLLLGTTITGVIDAHPGAGLSAIGAAGETRGLWLRLLDE